MPLQDVVAVEEGLFTIGLHPDLVLAVARKVVQACDVKLELLCLREFAKDCTSGQKLVPAYMRGHLQHICPQVVYSFTVQAEYILSVFTFDQKLYVRTEILAQLFEKYLGLFFCENAHFA